MGPMGERAHAIHAPARYLPGMSELPDAFYLPDGDAEGGAVVATALTRGPWDARFQHGGPPAALLAGALERFGGEQGEPGFALARLTFELHRPVPIDRLTVQVEAEKAGRQVQRLRAGLFSGDTLLVEARGLRIRRAPLALPDAPPPPAWPAPRAFGPYALTFFPWEVGYHRAVELRLVHGAWGGTPIGFWTRPLVPLVAGRPSSAVERLVTLADAQSGMGVPLDPLRYTFVNPDLTVYLQRPPQGDWIGFDIRSGAGPLGAGLAESAIRDQDGLVGRSAQSLLVAPRG